MNKKEVILIQIICVCLFSVGFLFGGFTEAVDNKIICKVDADKVERLIMYDKKIGLNKTLNGVYHYDGYYCVWTEGRDNESIYNTEVHEKCHALIINDDKNHFCS